MWMRFEGVQAHTVIFHELPHKPVADKTCEQTSKGGMGYVAS